MKKFASVVLLPLAFATPLLANAFPVIDLKAALKAGMPKNPDTPAPAPGANGKAGTPGQVVDSTVVTPVLANLKIDIAGVRLGMSGEEAKQVIKKLNPTLHMNPVNHFNMVFGFEMTNDTRRVQVYPNGLDRFTVYLNEAGNVYYVKRELTNLPPERMINLPTFLNSLAEKFDAPGIDTRKRANNPVYYGWTYDMQGRQYIRAGGPGTDDPCMNNAINQFGYQERPLPSCAVVISSQAFSDSKNSQLVAGYQITISAPWLAHDAPTLRAGADSAARQRQADQDKVKENKPQL